MVKSKRQNNPRRIKLMYMSRLLFSAFYFGRLKPENRSTKADSLLNRYYKHKLDHTIAQEVSQRYIDLYHRAAYWHGTGMYQYDAHGNVINVLEPILRHGLRQAEDKFDPDLGVIMSVSVTSSRLYARAYADMHGCAQKEIGRFGSSYFWANYFFSRLFFFAIRYVPLRTKSGRAFWRRIQDRRYVNWAGKVNSTRYGMFSPFIYGGDIKDNFPVVVGISKRNYKTFTASPIVSAYELRIAEPVHTNDMTHIEVPEQKVEYVKQLAKEAGLTLQVASIEEAEHYEATIPFTKQISASKFTN